MESRYREIIEKCGEINQLTIAVEEMSELTKEICKYKRDPNKVKHYDFIMEELADVLVIAKQIQIIFGIPDIELDVMMNYKVDRTLERIKND